MQAQLSVNGSASTCNECGAANYESRFPGMNEKRTDLIIEVKIGITVLRLCPSCVADLRFAAEVGLQLAALERAKAQRAKDLDPKDEQYDDDHGVEDPTAEVMKRKEAAYYYQRGKEGLSNLGAQPGSRRHAEWKRGREDARAEKIARKV
jgi:glutaredoxin